MSVDPWIGRVRRCSKRQAPVGDGGSSSRFGLSLLRIAAQARADAAGLGSAPRRVETHPEHEKHRDHVEEPGEGEWREKHRSPFFL